MPGGELREDLQQGRPEDLYEGAYMTAAPNDEVPLERVVEAFEGKHGRGPERVVWYLGCPWVGPVEEGRER